MFSCGCIILTEMQFIGNATMIYHKLPMTQGGSEPRSDLTYLCLMESPIPIIHFEFKFAG